MGQDAHGEQREERVLSRAGVLGGHCREGENPGPPRVWLGGSPNPQTTAQASCRGVPMLGTMGTHPCPSLGTGRVQR